MTWYNTSGLSSPLQVIDGTSVETILPDLDTDNASIRIELVPVTEE